MMKTFYFDTSTINHLYNDSELHLLKNLILKNVTVYISVFTIAEIISTPCTEHRRNLLNLTKDLCKVMRPLAMPGELLKRSMEAINDWAENIDSSISSDWDGVWVALNTPERIDEQAYQEAVAWKQRQESWYQNMHDIRRPKFQEQFSKIEDNALISSFAKFIRWILDNGTLCEETFEAIATPIQTNIQVNKHFINRLIKHSEHWRFFIAGMAYGLYTRSIRTRGYSKKKNPGSIDTQQSIYLANCDIFVSNDKEHVRMLRLLAPFGHIKRRIWRYLQFRNWLINSSG